MKKMILPFFIVLINFIYSQCDYGDELSCNQNQGCEWIVTYQWYDCDNFSNSSQCNSYSAYGCYWDSHWYYSGWSDCDGPSFQLEVGGSCVEVTYNLGDINEDLIINILDVIETVNLITNSNYNVTVDMDSNGVVNVLDIIQLINIILNRS